MDNKPSFRTKKVELSIKRLVSEYLVTQKDYLLKFPNARFEITEVRVSKDGYFVFGIDRDRKFDVTITKYINGKKEKIIKKVIKRKHNIQYFKIL